MRSRNLKPGFFANEELAACSPFARLLYAGLWLVADREGRLEERPRRLKAQLFPYDDVDLPALLEELSTHGFILRYTVERRRYLLIPTFSRHQHPHIKEAISRIPPPKVEGAPDEHGARTGQAPDKPGVNPLMESLLPRMESPGPVQAPEATSTPPPAYLQTYVDAVCVAVYRKPASAVTASERSKALGPAAELQEMGVELGEIATHAAAWRTHWGHLTMSANALVSNWSTLGDLIDGGTTDDTTSHERRERSREARRRAAEERGVMVHTGGDGGSAPPQRPPGGPDGVSGL